MKTSEPDDLWEKHEFWGVEIRWERGENGARATKVKSERERALAWTQATLKGIVVVSNMTHASLEQSNKN